MNEERIVCRGPEKGTYIDGIHLRSNDNLKGQYGEKRTFWDREQVREIEGLIGFMLLFENDAVNFKLDSRLYRETDAIEKK